MNPLTLLVMLVVMMVIPVALAQSSNLSDESLQIVPETESTDIELSDSAIVINEVELNPPGEDGVSVFEWVEIYNPTREFIYIGNWTISSATSGLVITISSDVTINPNQYLTLSTTDVQLIDMDESISLHEQNGSLVDQTPLLTDVDDDSYSWKRKVDARDTDSKDDWVFGSNTRGHSNIVNPISERTTIVFNINTDKESYNVGEEVIISGSVTGIDLESTTFFIEPSVNISVNGPNYNHNVILKLDDEQEFNTSVNPQNVSEGVNSYDIVASFAGNISSESIIIRNSKVKIDTNSDGVLGMTIFTDRAVYSPGDTVIILAKSDVFYDYEGLEFVINGPSGKPVTNGILFPSDRSHSTALRTIDEAIAGDSQFGTTFFIDIISPAFGVHEIVGNYGDLSHTTSFEIENDVRADAEISFMTDKPAYTPGETVVISGRVNESQINTIDIDIEHQQNLVLIKPDDDARVTIFHIKDTITTQPDGRFTYKFDIPDESGRIGRYLVSTSESTLSEGTSFEVQDSASSYDTRMFSVKTDKTAYSLGEKITFSGKINVNDPYINESSILIKLVLENEPESSGVIVTILPDTTGRYNLDSIIEHDVFEPGMYTVIAQYVQETDTSLREGAKIQGTYFIKPIYTAPLYTDTTTIDIITPRNLGKENFTMKLDSETYNFGDTVNISGIVADTIYIQEFKIWILGPDGKSEHYVTYVNDDGTYSFDWETPTMRTGINVGAYTITVSFERFAKVITINLGRELNSVSENTPVILNHEKELYKIGETIKISGRVFIPDATSAYNLVPDIVKITIASTKTPRTPVAEFNVLPDSAGAYSVNEKTSGGRYSDGAYNISSTYKNNKVLDTFHIGQIPTGIRADTSR